MIATYLCITSFSFSSSYIESVSEPVNMYSENCPFFQSIKLVVVIISGSWAISQTWPEMIFFTIQAVIYIIVNIINIALQNPYVKLLTEITSLAMYTTQMCQLIGIPMILAYCNFLPLVLVTTLLLFHIPAVDTLIITTLTQIVIMVYCAFKLQSAEAFFLVAINSFIFFGPYQTVLSAYEVIVSLALIIVGFFAVSLRDAGS